MLRARNTVGVSDEKAAGETPNRTSRARVDAGMPSEEVPNVAAGSGEPVRFRALRREDAAAFETAFRAIGWFKPATLFLGYLVDQREGVREVIVAEVEDRVAGYLTLRWDAHDPVLRERGIPEIIDLNVLPDFRRRGIGTGLMDRAEARAATRAETVGLGVGLHGGYGAAQRLYVRRGYLPDGTGALVDGVPVPEGESVLLNDDLCLRLTKDLTVPSPGTP